MAGFLLHVGAMVSCAHGGQAQPAPAQPRVLLSGQPLLTAATVHTVTGCSFAPPSGNGPCVSAQWTSGAGRVRASGVPVLLSVGTSVCTPTGTPLVVTVTQQRVRGM